MKKKLGAIAMAGTLACTVFGTAVLATGCGKKIPDFIMPENGFDTSTEVEIKFSHTMGAELREVLDDSIAQFNVLYPNIKVVHEQVGDYPDLRENIITQINAQKQPNLAYCYPDHVAMFNNAAAVLPLNDFLSDGAYKDWTVTLADEDHTVEKLNFTKEQEESFIEGYWEEGYLFGDETKMYTLPFSKSTEVLYYNKTFFDENDIKVPTTWDEMEQACEKIKELKPDCTPLGYDSEANWFITLCEQYGSDYTSASGDHYLFDNATNRAFVQKLKGWYDKGYFVTKEINESYTSDLFKNTKSYMCIGSSAGAKNQFPARVDGQYPFEVGIAAIPQVDPENPKVISQGPSICIFKNSDPQKVLASWLFAKYFTTNVAFQARFSMKSGYVPVITTVLNNENYQTFLADAKAATGKERDAHLPAIAAQLCMDQEKAYYTSPAFVGSSEARDQVGYLMQAVFTDSKSIDEAFKDALDECRYIVG